LAATLQKKDDTFDVANSRVTQKLLKARGATLVPEIPEVTTLGEGFGQPFRLSKILGDVVEIGRGGEQFLAVAMAADSGPKLRL
jgi:hypothetical protein